METYTTNRQVSAIYIFFSQIFHFSCKDTHKKHKGNTVIIKDLTLYIKSHYKIH